MNQKLNLLGIYTRCSLARGLVTSIYARCARDVTFHQTNRPSGNLQEVGVYFSGKTTCMGTNQRFLLSQVDTKFDLQHITRVQSHI